MHEYRLSEPQRKNGSSKLDEWVLCRIYKKKSRGDTNDAVSGSQSKDCSHDEVLESLPEIDDRLPRFNSFGNLQCLGSGDFDWATLAGLTSVDPELVQAHRENVNVSRDMGSGNGVYAPAIVVDQVQSGNGIQFAQNYSISPDPFRSRYPAQCGAGLGFWQ